MRAVLTTVIAGLSLLLPSSARADIEEPAYTVERQIGDVEIRLYAPYVLAQVQVQGNAQSAGNSAFPILAGYIFGKNEGKQRMEMTAPVTQAPAPVKMAMTAPVTQQPLGPGAGSGFVVGFVLPKEITLENAPKPLDPRVQLRQMPEHRVAVIRYRGGWSQASYAEHLAKLQTSLREAGIAWQGEPVFSRFDPPITPWFLRRNEIWLAL